MSPLDALLWIAVAIGGLILLAIILGVILVVVIMIFGFRAMREDDEKETAIYRGAGQ